MANSLNVDLDYFSHPKTRRLVGILGKGAEVLPIKLWAYCGKYHAELGQMIGYTCGEIESIIEWAGTPGEAVAALLKVKYLEQIDGGYAAHDWVEYQGHIHAYKVRGKAAAMKKWSALGNLGNPKSSNATSTPKDASSNACGIPDASRNAASNATSITASNALCNAKAGEAFYSKAGIAGSDEPLTITIGSVPLPPGLQSKVVEAFSSWSIAAGGNPIEPVHNEDYPIRMMLESFSPEDRVRVVTAVEFCKREAKPFKNTKYAVGSVRGVIAENEDRQPKRANGNHRLINAANPPAGQSIRTTQVFGKT